MARGRKTGGKDFGPTNPPPKSPGHPKLSQEAKDLRKLTASEFIKCVTTYFRKTEEQLKLELAKKDLSMLDRYICNVLIKGNTAGNYGTLDSMLNRIIGQVKMEMKLEHTGEDGGPIRISDARERLIGGLDRILAARKAGSAAK